MIIHLFYLLGIRGSDFIQVDNVFRDEFYFILSKRFNEAFKLKLTPYAPRIILIDECDVHKNEKHYFHENVIHMKALELRNQKVSNL